MKRAIAISISFLLIDASIAHARVIAAKALMPAQAPVLAPVVSLSGPGAVLSLTTSETLPTLKTVLPTSAALALPGSAEALPVSGPARSLIATPAARRTRNAPGVKGRLSTISRAVAPKAAEPRSSAASKSTHDSVWSGVAAAEKRDAVSVDAAPSPRRNLLGRLKSGVKRAGLYAGAAVPVAAASSPTTWIPVEWAETILSAIAAMPAWAGTAGWIGAGFAGAWIAPRVVRFAAKKFFRFVDWDPLREAYLVNLASSASWAGAIGYAVLQVGGLEALAVNSAVFGLTMTLAVKDIASNLAAGFSLHHNRTYEIGDRIGVLKEKGIVDSMNARYVMLDTTEEEVDYERVMIPNDAILDKAITNYDTPPDRWAKKLLGGAALPLGASMFSSMPPFVALLLKVTGIGALAIILGSVFNRGADWRTRVADKNKEDRRLFKRYSKQATFFRWMRNGSYIAGLWFILQMFGVPVSGIVGGLSILTAAVGFMTKDIANNLVAGLMIAVYRPFTKGDYVQIGDEKGFVEDITPRYIHLKGRAEDGGGDRFIPLELINKKPIRIGLKPASGA